METLEIVFVPAVGAKKATRDAVRAEKAKTKSKLMKLGLIEAACFVLIFCFWVGVSGHAKADPLQENPVVTENPAPQPSAVTEDPDCFMTVAVDIPGDEYGFYTYMDYRAITCTSSLQYKLQQSEYAWTDGLGFRRFGNGDADDYYMVAMGTYYAERCGSRFEVTLSNGNTFKVLVGDIKDNADTDPTHQHRFGNVIEFIVDSNNIPEVCRKTGSMGTASEKFLGRIVAIEEIFG